MRLWPLSLAEKCRITFGAAVIFILALGLLLPYVWMSQLTKKLALGAGQARAEALLLRHFRLEPAAPAGPAPLSDSGAVLDVNDRRMWWLPLGREGQQPAIPAELGDRCGEIIEALKKDPDRQDAVVFGRSGEVFASTYVRLFRANDNCISCHNPQGSAAAFSRGEPVGVFIVERPAAEISKILLMNRIWVIVAGLIAGVGAIVAFYMITQRVILRPVRQLRGLANNVAEGNLDIRSSIRTGDEYQKLAEAFNHMLDSLEAAQKRLRQANRQLDEKIAELSERNIELFKANKVKGEFLANISHEFRTPLNAILGFAEIMREKPGSLTKEKISRYADNIITSGNRLLNMINDLLNVAKAEAGKVELRIEQTHLGELCRRVVGHFSALTKRKKIKVRLTVAENLPMLTTDVGKVEQILYNFLSNAIKFTPERGRIEIRAQMRDEKTVRISVTDTGCGIAEADQEKIFEKFRQADGSITRQTPGTGLGLAISKELATLLAGTIGLQSEPGKGSTFWLDIPVVLVTEQSKTA